VQIADRAFIVTGASSGIGAATARALVDAGGRVLLVGRRADRLTALADQLGPTARAHPADITTAEAPDLIYNAAFDAFDRIDGLINVAGRGLSADVLRMDLDLLDESLELNLIAPLRLIQRVVPTLVEQGEGLVANVSSPTARMGLTGIAGYAMAKAGLDVLTETLRRELWSTGVKVIAVYPGVTETEFYDHVMGDEAGGERPPARAAAEVGKAIVRGIELNRREVWAMTGQERRRLRMMKLVGGLSPNALDRGLGRSS
jgi:short-subunit dehydrogenase